MSHLDEGQLHELLDGELDEPARAAALAHLASCERCKAAYDEAAAFLSEADALVDAVQLPAAVRRVAATSPAPAVPLPRRSRIPLYRTLAWAASIVAAVGIGWYGSNLRPALKEAVLDSAARDLADSAPAQPVVAAAPVAPGAADRLEKDAELRANAAGRTVRPAESSKSSEDKAGPDEALKAASEPAPATLAAVQPRAEAAGTVAQNAPAAAAPPPAPSDFTPVRIQPTQEPRQKELEARRNRADEGSGLRSFGNAEKPTRVTGFRVIRMEEAVRILGGSIRLIDGITPSRILSGRIPGESGADLVRVVYEDPPGRELWLDQQRGTSTGDSRAGAATALLPGDTLMVVREEGVRSLDWTDQTGFLLRLTGFLPADSLLQLRTRIR